MKKKILSVFTTLAILCSLLGIMPTFEVSASGLSFEQLQAKFPSGKYWNHSGSNTNNPDGYTSTPCTHHNPKAGYCSSKGYNGWCGCNSFNGTSIQCFGFAFKCGYDMFGSDPNGWSSSTNLNNLKPGDIVRYKNNGHSIFVTSVNGDTVTYGDCNSDGHCKIMWNKTISKSTLKASLTKVHIAPGTPPPIPIPQPVDGYNVPQTVIADHKIYTCDIYGNKEGNRWIDSGDECVISTVYDNGMVSVNYPTSSGRRDAYAPLSDFPSVKPVIPPNPVNEKYRVSTSSGAGLNVRSTNNTSGTIIQTVDNGTEFIISQKSSNNWGYCSDLGGWLCLDYCVQIPIENPPSNAKVTIDKSSFAIGENVKFTFSSTGATGYTIGIDDGAGNRIDTSDSNGSSEYTRSFSSPGKYSCYVTAYNSAGYTDSERIYFEILEDNLDVSVSGSTSKDYIKCSWQAYPNATGYNLNLYDKNQDNKCVYSVSDINGTSCSLRLPEGNYSVSVSPSNQSCKYNDKNSFKVSMGLLEPSAVKEFNGHIYALYTNSVYYDKAEELCKSFGGHLATITSKNENNIILSMISENGHYWLGGKRSGTDFVWNTDEPFSYKNWYEGEPNNAGNNENYLDFYKSNDLSGWNDNSSGTIGHSYGFILEIDSEIPIAAKETFKGHTYYLFDTHLNWTEAHKYCTYLGGELVTINDKAENDFIVKLAKNGKQSRYFTGMYSPTRNKEFVWKSGEPVTYSNWYEGEPNNYDNEEYFGEIIVENGMWNDVNNYTTSRGFICEFEVEPTPYSFKGKGTDESPYLITSKEELEIFRDLVNNGKLSNKYNSASYKLTTDIDLKNDKWTPIGKRFFDGEDTGRGFAGHFDGGNHTIKGLYVNENSKFAGLFGSTAGGKSCLIENLAVEGTVINTTLSTGGIIGEICAGGGIVRNCCFIGDVTGKEQAVGGIVGYLWQYGYVENCYHIGKVTCPEHSVGGIAGKVALGSVSDTSEIKNCYHAGKIEGLSGSIVGIIEGNGTNEAYIDIVNCYALSEDGNALNSGEARTLDITILKSDKIKKAAGLLGNAFAENPDSKFIEGYPVFNWQIKSEEKPDTPIDIIKKGDINNDSKITVSDMVLIQNYLTKKITLDNVQLESADLNNNGKVDVFDLIILKRKLLNQK